MLGSRFSLHFGKYSDTAKREGLRVGEFHGEQKYVWNVKRCANERALDPKHSGKG